MRDELAESDRAEGGLSASASIVVPILENASVLELFLSGLNATVPGGVQLILVDDGCNADTQDVLRRWRASLEAKFDVSILSNPRPLGDGAAFNLGAERARGDFVIRLDSDLIFSRSWINELLSSFDDDSNVGIASGVLLYPQSGGINHAGLTFYQFAGRHLFLNARHHALPPSPYPVQTGAMGFAAVRRDVLCAAGGFDPSYHSGYDDLDLGLRIAELGYSTLVTPRATAFHWERSAGPHRDAGRKRNLALFWHRWGGRIVDDLWSYLTPAFEMGLKATPALDARMLLCIDLLGDRVGAEQFWADVAERRLVSVLDIRRLSHRCSGDGPIALPLVLGSDGHSEPNRMLFLTDNFVRLRGNGYFFERRMQFRSDDLIIDLHGNVVLAHELAMAAWPGEKVR